MIIPINWLNYYVAIYRYMKMTYHNHDMEDYIDYHDIRYILHITSMYVCMYVCILVLGRMVEHSNIRSLSNFQQMFCFTKPS